MPERTPPPKPGIYYDVPEAEYRAWDAYNWSALARTGISMEQFKWDWDHPSSQSTPAQVEGTVLHAFVLEPDEAPLRHVCRPREFPVVVRIKGAKAFAPKAVGETGREYVVATGLGSKRHEWTVRLVPDDSGEGWAMAGPAGARERVRVAMHWWVANATFCQAWTADMKAKGFQIHSRDVLERCRGMAARLLEVPDVQRLLDGAPTEVCVVWRDPQTNLLCKARLDAWSRLPDGDAIPDVKTSARPVDVETFAWTIKKWKYTGQAAMYLDGLRGALKAIGDEIREVPQFHFLAVQSFPPYTPRPWHFLDHRSALTAEWVEFGRRAWHGALQQVAYCLKTGVWPGHEQGGDAYPSSDEIPVPSNMTLILPEENLR